MRRFVGRTVARFGGGQRRRRQGASDARLADNFGPESVFADAHDDDLDGARMEDDARSAFSGAETRRAAPIPVPSVPRRLLAKYTGRSRPSSSSATRPGGEKSSRVPRAGVRARVHHVAPETRRVRETTRPAHTRLPRGVVRDGVRVHLRAGRGVTRGDAPRSQFTSLVGLYGVDADRADAAGPGYIGSLLHPRRRRRASQSGADDPDGRGVRGGASRGGRGRTPPGSSGWTPPTTTNLRRPRRSNEETTHARGGAAEEAAAYASASANGGTAEEVAAAAYASRRTRRRRVAGVERTSSSSAVPGWGTTGAGGALESARASGAVDRGAVQRRSAARRAAPGVSAHARVAR